MYGSGSTVFAVWGFAISKAIDSRVELNVRRLADTLGDSVENIEKALEFLTAPDPKSRCKEHEGRRLVKEGEYQYFMPSWESYRAIRNEDERRAYNRKKMAELRAKKKAAKSKNSGHPLPGERAYCRDSENGDTPLDPGETAEMQIAERKAEK